MNTGIFATSISSFGECRSNAKHFLSPDQTWCGATHPACTKSAREDSFLGGFEWVSNWRLTEKKNAVLYVYILYTVHAVISYMLVTRMLTGVRKESSQFHWSNGGSCQPWSQDSLENPSYPQGKIRIVSTNLQQTRSHKQYIIQQRAVFRLVKRSAKRCRIKMLMMLKFL